MVKINIWQVINMIRSRFKWLIVMAIIAVGVAGYLAVAKPTIIKGGASVMIGIKSLEELVNDSSLIIIGVIEEQRPSKKDFDSDNPSVEFIYTEYVIKVERYLLSREVDDDRITIKILGGKVDFTEFISDESPIF